MKTQRLILTGLLSAALLGAPCLHAQTSDNDRLAFMKRAKVGLFVHYVYGKRKGQPRLYTPMDANGRWPKDLNELADSFDPQKLAAMASDMGVEYVVFTCFHASMYMMYPSKVMGDLFPYKAARRDVMKELLDGLDAKGIKLVFYWHPKDSHDLTPEENAAIVARYKDFGTFVIKLMEETSSRYGDRVAGYWLDGLNGNVSGQAYLQKLKPIILKNSPHAAVWTNVGKPYNDGNRVKGLADLITSEFPPNFAKGGNSDVWNTHNSQMNIVASSCWWPLSKGKASVDARNMLRFTVRVAATKGQANGGCTWDAGPRGDNTWEPGVRENFSELGKLLKARKEAIFGTVPSTAYVTLPKTTQRDTWGVATDSANGRAVYLHVLNPPANATLQIPKAADNRVFAKAALLDGKPVTLQATDQGYRLSLPPGAKWDSVDTVIRLEN